MSAVFRRFELILPLRFNDGSSVPDELIADVLIELEDRFGPPRAAPPEEIEPKEEVGVPGPINYGTPDIAPPEKRGCVYWMICFGVAIALWLAILLFFAPHHPTTKPAAATAPTESRILLPKFGQLELWMTTYLIEVI